MAVKKTIPIKAAGKPRVKYDCAKCPGYCCTYSLIEVGKRDIQRLARHFGITHKQAETRFTKYDKSVKARVLRHKEDEHFTTSCRFLDSEKRRCTIYEARPGVCRAYPDGARCGYYEFLVFEREQQGDDKFIATT